MSAKPPVSVIVVMEPGLLRNAMLAFLTSHPALSVVALLFDAGQALDSLRIVRADALVVDVRQTGPAVLELFQQVHQAFPAVNCVALADSPRQQAVLEQAGASHVLLRGMLESRLLDVLLAS